MSMLSREEVREAVLVLSTQPYRIAHSVSRLPLAEQTAAYDKLMHWGRSLNQALDKEGRVADSIIRATALPFIMPDPEALQSEILEAYARLTEEEFVTAVSFKISFNQAVAQVCALHKQCATLKDFEKLIPPTNPENN